MVACVATAVVWLLVKTAVPLIHRRMGQSRLASVRIVPPIEGAYNTASWVTFFQMLHATAAPWWKRALFGQAWLVFELEAHEGHVIARCWFPTGPAASWRPRSAAHSRRQHHPPKMALHSDRLRPLELGSALWRRISSPLGASHTDPLATAS